MSETKVWRALEMVGGGAATMGGWQRQLGEELELFSEAWLTRTERMALAVGCPNCACAHEVIRHGPDDVEAVCTCDELMCEPQRLRDEDIVIHEVNWERFERSVSRALGCDYRHAGVDVDGAWQIGTFSGVRLPVVLTLRPGAARRRAMAAELAARLRGPYALLAPTDEGVDVRLLELMRNWGAGFFDLESELTLLPGGRLVARRSGGEMFSRLLPAPAAEVTSDSMLVWRLFMELAKMGVKGKAPPAQVFDLMVFKGKSKAETALACGCAASLITLRVEWIETHFGKRIEQLRAYASELKDRLRTVKGDRAAGRKAGAWEAEPEELSAEEGAEEDAE